MTAFLQMLVGQLPVAATYALIGLGFVLIYRTTKALNLAQGALALVGAYIAYSIQSELHVGFLGSAAVGIIGAFLVSCGVYITLMRPLLGQSPIVVIILTLALVILVEGVIPIIWGPGPNYLKVPQWYRSSFRWGPDIVMSHINLLLLVLVVVLVTSLLVVLRWTPLGLATRAAAEDVVLATARGINVSFVSLIAWGLAGSLAAIAAIAYGATQGLTGATVETLGFAALPAIILGGIDSVGGVLIGALALAEAQGLAVLYVNGQTSVVIGYVLLLAVLIVRPRGLFGSKEVIRL